MTTEEIIKALRKPKPTRETTLEAAARLEGMHWELTQPRLEPSRRSVCAGEQMSTTEFASSLRARHEGEAAGRLEELHQRFFDMVNQRDTYRAEVAQLQKQLSQAIAERAPHDYGLLKEEAAFLRKERDERVKTECGNQQLNTRPEPSRLEIAAMFFCQDWCDAPLVALQLADALIAAAKEAK